MEMYRLSKHCNSNIIIAIEVDDHDNSLDASTMLSQLGSHLPDMILKRLMRMEMNPITVYL